MESVKFGQKLRETSENEVRILEEKYLNVVREAEKILETLSEIAEAGEYGCYILFESNSKDLLEDYIVASDIIMEDNNIELKIIRKTKNSDNMSGALCAVTWNKEKFNISGNNNMIKLPDKIILVSLSFEKNISEVNMHVVDIFGRKENSENEVRILEKECLDIIKETKKMIWEPLKFIFYKIAGFGEYGCYVLFESNSHKILKDYVTALDVIMENDNVNLRVMKESNRSNDLGYLNGALCAVTWNKEKFDISSNKIKFQNSLVVISISFEKKISEIHMHIVDIGL